MSLPRADPSRGRDAGPDVGVPVGAGPHHLSIADERNRDGRDTARWPRYEDGWVGENACAST